jgi:hypothetical protein
MSVIFSPLGAEFLLTFSCALTDPSVALNKGPNIAAAAALRSNERRVNFAFCRLLIMFSSLSCQNSSPSKLGSSGVGINQRP